MTDDAPQFHKRNGKALAYHFTPGKGPGVVFLGGFMSDMTGTKAVALEAWARAEGRSFLRLDYSGHGQSEGAFDAGCIGDWYQDARGVIAAVTEGPQVIVGSSMGGWIALLIARHHAEKVAGLVTVAAAPDFTEDGFWAGFDEAQQAEIMEIGQIHIPSDYGAPYVITKLLIEEGRSRLILRDPLPLPFPVRFLLGTADTSVSVDSALRLLDHAEGPDLRLTLVRGADHRFSEPDEIALIERSIAEVLERIDA